MLLSAMEAITPLPIMTNYNDLYEVVFVIRHVYHRKNHLEALGVSLLFLYNLIT